MTGCGGSPPRDPEKYIWTGHFRNEAMPSPYRFLTETMVNETIADGRDCDRIEAGAGYLRRKKTYEGVDAVLVLPENEPAVITGWTEISSIVDALASDRWSQKQIERIRAYENFEHKPGPNRDEMRGSDDYLNWDELRRT